MRALVKEFSEPPKSSQSSSHHHPPVQPSSILQTSQFQTFGKQINRTAHKSETLLPQKLKPTASNPHDEDQYKRIPVKEEHKFLTVPTLTKRLSRSMESLDNILKELSDVIAKEPNWAPKQSQKRLSNSLWILNDSDDSPNRGNAHTLLTPDLHGW